jgi:hypothetical protein
MLLVVMLCLAHKLPDRLQKRGPKADPGQAQAQQIASLTRERDQLQIQLDKAKLVIEVQKKVAALLGPLAADSKHGSA